MRYLLALLFVTSCYAMSYAQNKGVLEGGVDPGIYGTVAATITDVMATVNAKDAIGTRDKSGRTITAIESKDDNEIRDEITKLEQDIPDLGRHCQQQYDTCQAQVNEKQEKLNKIKAE